MAGDIYVPRKLLDEVRKRGVELTDLIFSALIKELKLDPDIVIEAHLELADRYLKEAKECISKGDSVRASEKLYKVAEECIKALAVKFRILRPTRRIGRGVGILGFYLGLLRFFRRSWMSPLSISRGL